MLVARLFEFLAVVCSRCGADDRRIVAIITQSAQVARMLNHSCEPAKPPQISPTCGPPVWDDPAIEAVPDGDALA